MSTLSGLRFVFVTGKGGVGKSTVSALLGAAIADKGKKVLVAADAGGNALGYLFNRSVSEEPTRIHGGLYAMRIEPRGSMREYAEDAIGSRLISNAIFNERVAQGFLEGIPGLLQWALLGKAWYATTDAQDGPEMPEAPFDTVIFDGFATGDGTELLRLPETLMKIAPPGRLRRDAAECYSLLRDAEQSRVLTVTLPSLLPATETKELVNEIRSELGYPLAPLVVNQVRTLFLSDAERERLLANEPAPTQVARFLADRAGLEQSQALAFEELRSAGLPLIELPAQFPPPREFEGLVALARRSGIADLEFA